MKQFPKIQVSDRKLSMIQDAIVDAINPILSLPLTDSNYLQGITLVEGDNRVNHGLGRNLRGWFVTRRSGDDEIYDRQGDNPTPALTLLLVACCEIDVDLIVF